MAMASSASLNTAGLAIYVSEAGKHTTSITGMVVPPRWVVLGISESRCLLILDFGGLSYVALFCMHANPLMTSEADLMFQTYSHVRLIAETRQNQVQTRRTRKFNRVCLQLSAS